MTIPDPTELERSLAASDAHFREHGIRGQLRIEADELRSLITASRERDELKAERDEAISAAKFAEEQWEAVRNRSLDDPGLSTLLSHAEMLAGYPAEDETDGPLGREFIQYRYAVAALLERAQTADTQRDQARSALEDLQGEVGRMRAENEREEALKWFLKVLAGASGQYESGDTDWCPINCFCGDFEPTDTYNWAIERGFTTSSFNSMFETSTAYLTEAGREYIASAALNPSPEAKS